MWSPNESAQMDERARRNEGNKRRDNNEFTTDNADSGFLSAGNIQESDEIHEMMEQEQREKDRQTHNRNRQATLAPAPAPGATTSPTPSSSATVTAVVEESTQVTDSDVVDVDLSEGLNQLHVMNQPGLDVAGNNEDWRRPESMTIPLGLIPITDKAKNKSIWQELYHTRDDDGDTYLHTMIIQNYVEFAVILIRLVPYPDLLNTYNNNCQSPLHLAVLTKQLMIIRQLILAGADPSRRDSHGNTALHIACTRGDLACAKALTDPLSAIEKNKIMPGEVVYIPRQNLELRNYNGATCLHLAAENGYVDLMRLLLHFGANIETKEWLGGRTVLHIAIENKHQSVVDFLLQECKPCLDTKTYSGLTAYQQALYTDVQLAEKLIRYGARPEPLPESDSDNSENSSEDEACGEAHSPYDVVKVQNAIEVNV